MGTTNIVFKVYIGLIDKSIDGLTKEKNHLSFVGCTNKGVDGIARIIENKKTKIPINTINLIEYTVMKSFEDARLMCEYIRLKEKPFLIELNGCTGKLNYNLQIPVFDQNINRSELFYLIDRYKAKIKIAKENKN